MKYICIKECCTLDVRNLLPKRRFIAGQIYEFEHEPDKRLFKRLKNQKYNEINQ